MCSRLISDGLPLPVTHIYKPSGKQEEKKNFIVDQASICSKNARQAGFQRPRTPLQKEKKKSGLLSLAQRPESSGFFIFSGSQHQRGTSYPAYAHKRCEMHTPCSPACFPGYAELRTPPVPWLGWLSLLALHLSRIPAEHPPIFITLRTAREPCSIAVAQL